MSVTNRPFWPSQVDVVVVGGGFSGLQAALDLQKSDLRYIVLEANERVGGKSFTKPLKSGPGLVEMGCTWFNTTTQKRVAAMVQNYGLESKEQYVSGDEILYEGPGKLHKNKHGILPKTIGAKDIEDLERILGLVVSEGAKLNPETPGRPRTTTQALSFEDTSVAEWLDRVGAGNFSQNLISSHCAGVIGAKASQVGLYFYLEMMASCGNGPEDVLSDIYGGAQHLKIKTGTSSIITAMQRSLLQDSVFVSSPVSGIHQTKQRCIVTVADGRTVNCSKVILAIPSNQYTNIEFSPPLPRAKRELACEAKGCSYNKIILTYKKPWWKELGLAGKFFSVNGPISFSWDISDDSTQQYSLALFSVASHGEWWENLTRLQLEKALLDHLSEMVGAEYNHLIYDVLEYNEQLWGKTLGIEVVQYPALGAGSYNTLLPVLKESFMHVHFAGTEMASVWRGYMEGALESGERAAAEVIPLVKNPKPVPKL